MSFSRTSGTSFMCAPYWVALSLKSPPGSDRFWALTAFVTSGDVGPVSGFDLMMKVDLDELLARNPAFRRMIEGEMVPSRLP
jgi:hypothetical protein